MLKFGKRMVVTNTDNTINEHLSAIHDHLQKEKNSKKQKLEEERAYIQKVKAQMEMDEDDKRLAKEK